MANFEVYDDSGKVQLRDTDPVIALTKRINVTSKITHSEKLFALLPSNVPNTYLMSGNGYRSVVFFNGIGTVLVFENTPTPTSEKYGLEIYSPTGLLTYSSNQKCLNILDRVYVNNIKDVRSTVSGRERFWAKKYSGKEVAIVIIRQPLYMQNGDEMTNCVYTQNGYLVVGSAINIANPAFGGGLISRYILEFLVVDVTGY